MRVSAESALVPGVYTWICESSNGGIPSSCSANKPKIVTTTPITNQLPIATITTPNSSASPVSVTSGNIVNFIGSSVDPDGTIVAHEWREGSCSNGTILSTTATWSKSDFSIGTHMVYFRSKDNSGAWSTNCQGRNIGVNPPIALCSYPAPPVGCDYMQGPDYNNQTSCGMILKCTPTQNPIPTPASYLLTTVNTNGVMISSPTGIDCGRLCSSSYNSGIVVTLSVRANSGYTFTGWSGCTSGLIDTSCIVTMNEAKTITANFAAIKTSLPIQGICGSSNGMSLSTLPATNLCSSG